MTLKPTDMLEIQSAIDEYERKFPRRSAPSAEVALAWRIGKRAGSRILREGEPFILPDDATPWVRKMLRGMLVVGGWSAGAVVTASLFFFGALVGGFQ